MDRITKSLLDEFSCEHGVDRLPEETQFEHFGCYLTVQRHHSETFDTADVQTGAGGDTGIDGIATIVNHILLASRLLANLAPLPRSNSHEMQRYCESMLELLWDVKKADELFAKAAGAVEVVAKGNFHRDSIRTQPFIESLKDQCGHITA